MQHKTLNHSVVTAFFEWVTTWTKTVIFLGMVMIVIFTLFLPLLEKDTRTDAFIPAGDPALVFRDKTREIFGLQDPMVVAVINNGKDGVFTPHTLQLISWLTKKIKALENIDSDRITSLATEKNIYATSSGMVVEPFFKQPPTTQKQADAVRLAIMDFPLYQGSLVARDNSGTVIVAELLDQKKAQQVYQALLELIAQAPLEGEETIHIAGEGAVSGFMGSYIDADAFVLNPVAGLVITLVCFICFRTLRGVMLPNLVVLATATSALGLMAATGTPFFVITNALPVVLIGIAVADSIHILSQYYEEIATHPSESSRQITLRTMKKMWRPVTLTSLTTIAGFIGLSVASIMPPMKFFGLFATFGVAVAWLFSVAVLPAFLSRLKLKSSPVFKDIKQQRKHPIGVTRLLIGLGELVVSYPRKVLMCAAIVIILGIIGSNKILLDEAMIRTFHQQEKIHIADTVLNSVFDGTHYLDIMIETENSEDLFKPENLKRIEALQEYLQAQAHVNGTTSIVDYLKQMNRVLNDGHAEDYRLPTTAELSAQYFLLYSMSSDPTDFKEVVDYDYRLANVRARLDSGRYTIGKVVVEATQQYIDQNFNAPGISAKLSGRVNVDYNWIKRLAESHFVSIAIALLLVLIMAALSFRSLIAGLLVLLPVVFTILMIYAVMGFSGIWLSISTSMFAAISIGLGVDFSIHTLEQLQAKIQQHQGALSLNQAILKIYPSTGRALLFNFLALSFGFGVLSISKVVVLQEFGILVVVAIATSFLASLTLLPALVKVIKPSFIGFKHVKTHNQSKMVIKKD